MAGRTPGWLIGSGPDCPRTVCFDFDGMPSPPLIQPRTLKGFRDFLPETMIPRERIVDTARHVYRSFGFSPIETPALEYLDILTGKGSDETDKQLYRFQDHGGRWVGLRFDLTIPLARYVAQHINELGTPFKRYHIGTVWRGEKPHRGRFREFAQCDFDTIGTLSAVADVETAVVIHELLTKIGFDDFTIRLNNRQVLNGLLEQRGLLDRSTPILRALDKLTKIGPDGVERELVEQAELKASDAGQVLALTTIDGASDDVLSQVGQLVQGSETGEAGVARLQYVLRCARAAGVAADRLRLDVSIARGLDYYTGTIFETYLDKMPGIGSVCSGGRYDNLAGTYTRQELPGVGASLGLDRLLAAMEELGMLEKVSTPAPVFIPFFDADRIDHYLALAARLRAAGIGVEVYPESKKLGQQLRYADRRGFRVALIMGEDEFAAAMCQVKDLATGSKTSVSLADDARQLIEHLARLLAGDA